MAEELKVAPEKLKEYGDEIDSLINKIDTILAGVTADVNSTLNAGGVWNSPASQETYLRYKATAEKYEDFKRACSSYPTFLRGAAEQFKQKDETLKAAADEYLQNETAA